MDVVIESVNAMLTRLRDNPTVVGLIRYGADHQADNYSVGDYDLFVVFSEALPTTKGLHFEAGHTPVDLSFITLQALKELPRTFTFPQLALSGGTVIFDRFGELEPALLQMKRSLAWQRPEAISEHALAFMRHGHRHVLDKLRGRLDSEPLLSRFLLGANPYWLMENYFRVRRLPFSGEGHALRYWREHEPEIYQTLESLYETSGLQQQFWLTEQLTELVLEPVGGAWQQGEVLAFGTEKSRGLTEKGAQVYQQLFGSIGH